MIADVRHSVDCNRHVDYSGILQCCDGSSGYAMVGPCLASFGPECTIQ